MDKNIVITATVSAVAGGVVGGVITYTAVNKKLKARYAEFAEQEINSVKARYALLRKDGEGLDLLAMAENPSPEVQAAVETGRKIIEQMGYSGFQDGVPSVSIKEEKIINIFDQGVKEEDLPTNEDEDEKEEPFVDTYVINDGEPYLISEEDYFANEAEYELDTLTYYAVDETLVDEKNSQIDRVDETIGYRHLHMFHEDKSKGKTSLYIRNDEHQTLYEVILVDNSYAAIVLGLSEETLGIKAPKERPKRMRDED